MSEDLWQGKKYHNNVNSNDSDNEISRDDDIYNPYLHSSSHTKGSACNRSSGGKIGKALFYYYNR